MMTLIQPGDITIGIVDLHCPKCRAVNRYGLKASSPLRDWMVCSCCGYRGLLDVSPLFDRYSIPSGLSVPERVDTTQWLKREVDEAFRE